jgi:chromosome segregation ATPase
LIESLTSNNNKLLDHINTIEDKLTVTNTNVAYLKQNLNSNDRLKDIHTKLSEIRSENLTDSGHMTELKTEVDDCRKIIKFLETEIGYKNDIINKLLENNTQLTTSCSNSEKMLTTLNEEMESIKTQLLDMSAKPKRSNETNSEDESDWSLVRGKKKKNVCSTSRNF